jgi:ribonuclease VapC
MIVDTSALVAIILNEPERQTFIQTIGAAKWRGMAAPALLEACMVLAGRFEDEMVDRFDELIAALKIDPVPFTADHAAVARQACLRFGKGRHPAGLNFGGCIAYATARLEAMPLLFKGDDFRLTDVQAAI